MKKSAIGILLIFLIFTLIFTSVAANIASEDIKQPEQTASPRVSRIPMKVCIEKMSYYKNESFEGSAIGTRKFGEIVYAEDMGGNIARIYNKSGNMLGYCSMFSLVDENARFIAEFPWQRDVSSGKISKLVDLRKYVEIFEASVTCNENDYVAIQYDTAMKLFRAARSIYDECGYILNVSVAHSASCTGCSEDHKTGGVLTLTITKDGESVSESIPLYMEDDIVEIPSVYETGDTVEDPSANEGEDSVEDPSDTEETPPARALSRVAQILADNSLIRVGETDCFADADLASYISTVINSSSVTYTVWE